MGSFIGHAATGSIFWLGGLFFILRAMGLRMLEPLRWNSAFLQAPGWTNIVGGIIYSFGEWWRTGTFTMMNFQHYLMASAFIISGLVQLFHMNGVLRGIGWAMVPCVNWFILGLLFNFHPQDDPKAEFGHLAMGWLFGFLTLLEAAQFLIGYYCSNPRAESHQGPILAMYKNPKIYGTPIPFLIGLSLMIIGLIDWDMAIDFNKEGHFKGEKMEMEMHVVMHTFANVIIVLLLSILLRKVDSYFENRCCGQSSSDASQWIASDDEKVWQYEAVAISSKPLEMHEL